jgi:thymidine kinase
MTGRIEVIAGSMFSGKTEELIRRVRRAVLARQQVQAFKPLVDNRYDKKRIVSHEGLNIDAVPISTSKELERDVLPSTRVVAIDEAQFFDEGIIETSNRLADRGLRVILAGLDLDFKGRPFGPMPALMAIAEQVTKVRAVCTECGADACRSQRLIEGESQVQIGGGEAYEARCRACYRVL